MQRSSETIGTIAAALAKAQPFVRMGSVGLNKLSVMPRCRAGSISCAKP
jgi:hypothetical protein